MRWRIRKERVAFADAHSLDPRTTIMVVSTISIGESAVFKEWHQGNRREWRRTRWQQPVECLYIHPGQTNTRRNRREKESLWIRSIEPPTSFTARAIQSSCSRTQSRVRHWQKKKGNEIVRRQAIGVEKERTRLFSQGVWRVGQHVLAPLGRSNKETPHDARCDISLWSGKEGW